MAAKGTQAKADITKKILETFSGSFVYGKEIRIPYIEDGVEGQIKITLTAAKVSVSNEENSLEEKMVSFKNSSESQENMPQEPTEEEKERLKMLLEKLGI